ncbi:MAG TPA: aconitate hydratase AcnA [Burkholderiales bacterium]|nr:aconitate hydratase AcnA [Burkholderiales bacterium]
MAGIDSSKTLHQLDARGRRYDYYSLPAAEALGLKGIAQLPYTLKVVLESVLRHNARGAGNPDDIEALAQWLVTRSSDREIGFKPARVLMVDSSGVPLMGDMAAMRDAMVRLGGDPKRINPAVPVDFVIDHSVMADFTGTPDALERNMQLEFERNRERYAFLRWGAKAFDNVRFVPPGAGICHQINLEYLARVVWTDTADGRTLAYPDSVLGMDSHTPMIGSLGIVGWGVGGLEGGTAALGEAVSMLIPEVIGVRLTGEPRPGVTATDVVLTITQTLRKHKLIGTFVEYFGPGVDALALQDRSTISNMTPEYGATMGFFPIDPETLRFLRLTGRPEEQVELVEAYARAQGLWRDATTPVPAYTRMIDIDLGAVEASLAGPRRPHERVPLAEAPQAFRAAYPEAGNKPAAKVKDGDVIIAAITSCTNTSNPAVMVGAGLLAKNAADRGLKPPPTVKASLSPGSRVVTDYLERNGLLAPLAELGFTIAGYGCMTCMGNSGAISDALAAAVDESDSAAVAVLSGNRNFEGRIHPYARANFLASPPLVVAYALAGSILKDLTREPLGSDRSGAPVFLRDIWPDPDEIRRIVGATLSPELFKARYADVEEGTPAWRAIQAAGGTTFQWEPDSTFIRRPPFFDDMSAEPQPSADIRGARVLAMFGDMLTTDHISPIGAISPGTPAAQYLESLGIARKDFVNYASRRLNHDVMTRGTFANIRIRNEMTPEVEGSSTRHMPSGRQMSIFDAAERYRAEGVPLVVIGGSEYGAGSSRDWAAKGTRLLGVRAVIAESFERIHRSNLVGMGVLPLQFAQGTTRKTLNLDGSETFDVTGLQGPLTPRMPLQCTITRTSGARETISLTCRLDTRDEVEYFRHGGLLHYVLRQRIH